MNDGMSTPCHRIVYNNANTVYAFSFTTQTPCPRSHNDYLLCFLNLKVNKLVNKTLSLVVSLVVDYTHGHTDKTVFACYQRSRVITKKWNHKGVKIVKNTGNVQGTRTQNSNLQNYDFTFLAKIIKIRFFFIRFLFSVQKKCLCLGHVKNWFSPKCSFCIKVCGTGMTCL